MGSLRIILQERLFEVGLFGLGLLLFVSLGSGVWFSRSGEGLLRGPLSSPNKPILPYRLPEAYVRSIPSRGEDSQGLPPIYWINLDRSTERRSAMEAEFGLLERKGWIGHSNNATRISAHDGASVKSLKNTGLLRLEDNITLVDRGGQLAWSKHYADKYEWEEAACLLSHLEAIRRAYADLPPQPAEDDEEWALILEDDAKLTSDFLEHWRDYVGLAPSDRRVLQLATTNPTVVKQGVELTKLGDAWLSWQPEHWSTRAYLINRAGMEVLLGGAQPSVSQPKEGWTLRGKPVLVADEYIYFAARSAYTTTYPFVDSFDLHSTVQSGRSHSTLSSMGLSLGGLEGYQRYQRAESLLVLTNLRIKSADGVQMEMHRLARDAEAVCAFHSVCDWHVRAILTSEDLRPFLEEARVGLPAGIELHVGVRREGFNKFGFVAEFAEKAANYDLFLFKDNDQRTAGFPWNTFVDRKGDAVLAGPLRQHIEASLLTSHNLPKRETFHLHDGKEWKEDWHTKWSSDLFVRATPASIPFVEMYFILMDGDFASWFFPQALIPEYIGNQYVDWGADLLWCAAAAEWRPDRPPCHLVPVVSKHEDSRQINRTHKWWDQGREMISIFRRKSPTLARWLDYSQNWKAFIDNKTLGWLASRCNALRLWHGSFESGFTLDACAVQMDAWIHWQTTRRAVLLLLLLALWLWKNSKRRPRGPTGKQH